MGKDALRNLPSVDSVLKELSASTTSGSEGGLASHVSGLSPSISSDVVREVLDELRGAIVGGRELSFEPSAKAVAEEAVVRLNALAELGLRRVVNASGTVLHTNLGRAVLSEEAIEAITHAARGGVDLEFDTGQGRRGERDCRAEELICRLTGAEAACIVGNNAAAVLITLNTLAEGREVLVSRGELVEIGGSFRLPDVIEKSGCVMREVGTTNRTHPSDYTDAMTDETAIIFKAHKSNYEVIGFTSEVELAELVDIGRRNAVPVVEDLGSGALIDMSIYGLPKEPVVSERIKFGADIVTFSGDKLLGGPQAGIIVGRKVFVERIRRNPLKRALRAGKLTLSALEATLRLYLKPEELKESLPTFRYLSRDIEEIDIVAMEGAELLKKALGNAYKIQVVDGESQIGSGSQPMARLKSRVISITRKGHDASLIFKAFLAAKPAILGRVKDDKFLLDMRTIDRASDIVPSGFVKE